MLTATHDWGGGSRPPATISVVAGNKAQAPQVLWPFADWRARDIRTKTHIAIAFMVQSTIAWCARNALRIAVSLQAKGVVSKMVRGSMRKQAREGYAADAAHRSALSTRI